MCLDFLLGELSFSKYPDQNHNSATGRFCGVRSQKSKDADYHLSSAHLEQQFSTLLPLCPKTSKVS